MLITLIKFPGVLPCVCVYFTALHGFYTQKVHAPPPTLLFYTAPAGYTPHPAVAPHPAPGFLRTFICYLLVTVFVRS